MPGQIQGNIPLSSLSPYIGPGLVAKNGVISPDSLSTAYIVPSGGDDTAQIAAAFNDLTVGRVVFVPSTQNDTTTWFKINQSNVLKWNPLRQSVEATGAIFYCGGIAQPPILAAGDQINFATALPTTANSGLASGTATRNPDGSVTFAGGMAGYPIILYPGQIVNYAATVTAGTLQIRRSLYLPAATSPDGSTVYVPAAAPGEVNDGNFSAPTSTSNFAFQSRNVTAIPQIYWLVVDTSGTNGAPTSVTLSSLTFTTPSTTQSYQAVITVDTSNVPPISLFGSGGSYDGLFGKAPLTGLVSWYANPWRGGFFLGKIDTTAAYPYVRTPGIAAFIHQSTDKSAVRSCLAYFENTVISGFDIGTVFYNSSFAGTQIGCHYTYNRLCVATAALFNSGEIFPFFRCFFNNNSIAFNHGAGGQIDLFSCHIDYNDSVLINCYGDVNIYGGWIETNAMQKVAGYRLVQFQIFYGRVLVSGTNMYYTHSSIAANNTYLVEVTQSNSQFKSTLIFENIRSRNMQAAVGLNIPPQTAGYQYGTVMLCGKIITTLPDGNVFNGPTETYRVAGEGDYVTVPVRAAIAASGSSQSITMPNNGAAIQKLTLSANCAITLAAPSGFPDSGELRKLGLIIVSSGFTATFTNSIIWANGITPSFGSGTSTVTLSTADNGVTWLGSLGIV